MKDLPFDDAGDATVARQPAPHRVAGFEPSPLSPLEQAGAWLFLVLAWAGLHVLRWAGRSF